MINNENRSVRKLRKNEYTLKEAKLFSKFPGRTMKFLKFLKEKKILISRRRIPDEYVKQGWFTYLEDLPKYESLRRKGRNESPRAFAVTDRGIDMIKWLVKNHIAELELKRIKDVKRKREKRRTRRKSSSNKSPN